MATLNENVARTKADFKAIKDELVNKGASIPSGTPTSQYANAIKNMSTGSSEESYEQGRQDVIAESKYIPKTATGKVISLTDVSEVSHKVKVVGVGNEVEVYGKNLCDYSKFTGNTQADKENVVLDGDTFIFPVGKTYYGLTMTGGIALIKGQTYTFSYEATTAYAYPECQIFYTDDTKIVANNGKTVTIEKDVKSIVFYLSAGREETADAKLSKFQVELGTQATKYELPSRQTITATPNGTEVSSLCPNMTFIADSDITVDYYGSFGMQTEYDRFWDSYQYNGNRTSYNNAFSGIGWRDDNFKPKYDMMCIAIGNMFISTQITDLVALLQKAGVVLDTSNATSGGYCFQASTLTRVPVLDLGKMTSTSATTCLLNNCKSLVCVDGVISSEKTVFHNQTFGLCTALTHCIFSGVIASNINLQWSPLLDKESLVSISVALCDLVFSGFGDGWGSRTLTLSAESIARLKELPYPPDDLNPEGSSYAEDGASCYTVITTRKGWNVA